MRQDPEFLRNFIVVLRENQAIAWDKQMDGALTEWINFVTQSRKIPQDDLKAEHFDVGELKR